MNRKEINEMMEKQGLVLKSESTGEKWLAGVCLFVAFLILCLV